VNTGEHTMGWWRKWKSEKEKDKKCSRTCDRSINVLRMILIRFSRLRIPAVFIRRPLMLTGAGWCVCWCCFITELAASKHRCDDALLEQWRFMRTADAQTVLYLLERMTSEGCGQLTPQISYSGLLLSFIWNLLVHVFDKQRCILLCEKCVLLFDPLYRLNF